MSIIATSVFWTSLGILLFRFEFIPSTLPKRLGRGLYWVGVPLQILALAHRSDFSHAAWLPPLTTVIVLLLGLGLASFSLLILKLVTSRWSDVNREHFKLGKIPKYTTKNSQMTTEFFSKVLPKHRSGQGSFVLASMLGNTGFVGLAIVPAFVDQAYLAWVVLYGVAHNLLGSYGIGVFLASYFGKSQQESNWWMQLRDLLSVPSLWAFAIGWYTRGIQFPTSIELGLQTCVLFVIPSSFLLIGMQLSQFQATKSLQSALVPTALKMLILPGIAGLGLTFLGLTGDARLALVLMSGMPAAFANVILAEEYNLDRQLAASSIVLSTVILPLTIPLWEALFK
jgi:hypothetical protein